VGGAINSVYQGNGKDPKGGKRTAGGKRGFGKRIRKGELINRDMKEKNERKPPENKKWEETPLCRKRASGKMECARGRQEKNVCKSLSGEGFLKQGMKKENKVLKDRRDTGKRHNL